MLDLRLRKIDPAACLQEQMAGRLAGEEDLEVVVLVSLFAEISQGAGA